ncbi:MAG: rhomboid family intramembrane serine protease [Planctomycetota bacterium]|nr:rhomboid family intramembrane serine protease [Planctomycetota bacterium]
MPKPYGRWFKWTILAAWLVVYLSCMAAAGWRFDPGLGFMGYGFPGLGVLNRHGAAVPTLVSQGDWHRLVLDPLINTSLIGFVFTLWVWASLGGMLLSIAGAGRSWIVFVVGGAAGAAAHAWQHPTLPFAGAGPSGAIMAATGALLCFGLIDKSPVGAAAKKRAIGYLIAIVLFTALFALFTGSNLIAMGTFEIYALAAGLLVGAGLMLVFGPRRIVRPPGAVVRALSFGLLAVVAVAVSIQAPRALAGENPMDRALDYLAKIKAVEQDAWKVKSRHEKTGTSRRAQLEGTRPQREALTESVRAVRGLAWLEKLEGREALMTYLDAFGTFERLDWKLLSIEMARMKQAFERWQPYEQRMLLEAGVPGRDETIWTSEFPK